jgi:hypothetical protein
LTLALVRRRFKLSFDLEAVWKSFAASTVMAIVVWFTQYVFYSRFLIPAYSVVGAITYLIGPRLLTAASPTDTQLAVQFLGKRYKPLVNLVRTIFGSQV